MNTLLTIIKYTPVIVELVKQAEVMVGLSGKGKEKLDFVLGSLEDTIGDIGSILPAITKVVTRIVDLFNKTGIFSK